MEQRERVGEGRELRPLHVLIPQTLIGKHRAAEVGRNETGRDVCFALDLPKSSLKRDQSSLCTRSERFQSNRDQMGEKELPVYQFRARG